MRKFITGHKQVERMLRGMQDRDADKIARSSLGAGVSVLRKEMRAAAPVGPTKNLQRSIGSRLVKKKGGFVIAAKTGINVGKRTKKQIATRGKTHRAPHGHLVALGTKERFHASGKSTGVMPANAFVRRVTVASRQQVHAAMVRKAREKTKLYNQRRRP